MKDGSFNRDALVAVLRYDYRTTVFSLSFDINISSLAKASTGLGGPELSFIKYFDFYRPVRRKTKVKCPEF